MKKSLSKSLFLFNKTKAIKPLVKPDYSRLVDLKPNVQQYVEFVQGFEIKENQLMDAQEDYKRFLQLRGKRNDGIMFMYATHLLRPKQFEEFMSEAHLKCPKPWYNVKDGKLKPKHTNMEPFDLLPELDLDLMEEELVVSDTTLCAWIDKYSKFLTLKQKYPKVALVPTLDIDVVWHAHQLDHVKYRQDSNQYLGYLLNHNDLPSNNVLLNAFGVTVDLWKREFGQNYIENTMTKKVTLSNKNKKKTKESSSHNDTLPTCLSCGFGDHSSHSKMPHNTGKASELPETVSHPDQTLAIDQEYMNDHSFYVENSYSHQGVENGSNVQVDSSSDGILSGGEDSIADLGSGLSCLSCVTIDL